MESVRRETEFGQILKGALALSLDDQARLCAVLQRVTGAPSEVREASAVPANPDTTPQGVDEWVQSIQHQTGWDQLQLLDDALENTGSVDDAKALHTARERLLQANPALAVRGAVVDLAARHPIGVLLGSVGLVLAVVGVGRLLFGAVF